MRIYTILRFAAFLKESELILLILNPANPDLSLQNA
jgi:hypothetical protein